MVHGAVKGLVPCIYGCELSFSFSGGLTSVERALGTCWIGGWVDKVVEVTVWKEKGSVACVGNRTAVGQTVA